MKKMFFSAFAIVAMAGSSFAGNGSNGKLDSRLIKTPEGNTNVLALLVDLEVEHFDCYYHLALFDGKGNYVRPLQPQRTWTNSEEDCLQLIQGAIKEAQDTYKEYEVRNIQNL